MSANDRDSLDAIAAAVHQADLIVQSVRVARSEDLPALSRGAQQVQQQLAAAKQRLHAMGATFTRRDVDTASGISLSDLAAVARVQPDAEELLAGLRTLLPIAERIDAARGRALAEPVAGSAGLDLAEDIVQLLARLELDLYGPSSAVTGARE